MKEDIQLNFRDTLAEDDVRRIKELTRETGVFSSAELDVAEELLLEGYQKGASSYYKFLIAEREGNIEGYSCYAQISGTAGSFEVYWIVVRKEVQGAGVGKNIMAELERIIRKAEGKRIFVGTSSRDEYSKARLLYESTGYGKAAVLEDYFGSGDHQLIFMKRLL